METQSPPETGNPHPKRWMWISIAVSTCIIAWAFTIPMRHSSDDSQNSSDLDVQTSTVSHQYETTSDRKLQAEQYRAYALELDRELMRMQREKDQRYRSRSLPGDEAAQAYQENYRKWMLDEIDRLATASEKSPEWEFRQQLIQSLDAPQ